MPVPAITAAPEVAEVATMATDLLKRALSLVERSISAAEQSPEAPDRKTCEAYVSMIKRVADTLKTLTPLQNSVPTATTHAPSSPPPASPIAGPSPSEPVSPPSPAPMTTAPKPRLDDKQLSPLRNPPKQAPATRSYGEMLSRR